MAVNGNLFPWKVPRPHSYSTPILASSRGIEPTSDRCVVRNNLKAHVIGLPVRKLEHLNRSTTIARAGCWRECLLSQYWASITSEAKRLIVDSLYMLCWIGFFQTNILVRMEHTVWIRDEPDFLCTLGNTYTEVNERITHVLHAK